MKKHDEGYALVFVLIVMVVLSIVATTLMTGAMKNLQAQNTSLSQMQAKYKAQGEIEKAVQLICMESRLNSQTQPIPEEVEKILLGGLGPNGQHIPGVIAKIEQPSEAGEWVPQGVDWLDDALTWLEGDESCMLTLVATNSGVRIETEIILRDIVNTAGRPFEVVYNTYTVEYLAEEVLVD